MNTLAPILFIEDNSDDVFFFKRILADTGVQNPVLTFEDGAEAVEYLTSMVSKPETVLPLIIFTDLRMSEMGGLEFCRWLRGHPPLEHMTMFVLSGSDLEKDIHRSNDAGVNGYLVKFPTGHEITAILRSAGGTFKNVEARIPGGL